MIELNILGTHKSKDFGKEVIMCFAFLKCSFYLHYIACLFSDNCNFSVKIWMCAFIKLAKEYV